MELSLVPYTRESSSPIIGMLGPYLANPFPAHHLTDARAFQLPLSHKLPDVRLSISMNTRKRMGGLVNISNTKAQGQMPAVSKYTHFNVHLRPRAQYSMGIS